MEVLGVYFLQKENGIASLNYFPAHDDLDSRPLLGAGTYR